MGRLSGAALAVVCCALAGAGCSPSVSREGYVRPPATAAQARCAPVLKRRTNWPADRYQVVGKIEIGDTGFSTDCSEADVVAVLHKEACEVGADVIDVLQEHRPDIGSSCYRVEARFLRVTDPAMKPIPDPHFQQNEVAQRSDQDDSAQTAIIIGAVVAGVVAGVLTAVLVAK